MLTANPGKALRKLVLLDAGTCLAMGLLLVSASGFLASLTAIPAGLLFYAGAVLFPVAAFMAITAFRLIDSAPAVWLIIGGNVLWVIASVGLMVGGWISPNGIGLAFIGIQAAAVALLAALELAAWRRMTRSNGVDRGVSRAAV